MGQQLSAQSDYNSPLLTAHRVRGGGAPSQSANQIAPLIDFLRNGTQTSPPMQSQTSTIARGRVRDVSTRAKPQPAPPMHSEHAHQDGVVTSEQVGRATWTLLHTVAAQLPDRPSGQMQRTAKQLVHSIAGLYPCESCASHFREMIATTPPTVGSRQAFSEWVCNVHNQVNLKLGKEVVACEGIADKWVMQCDDDVACKAGVGGGKKR